MSNKYYCIVLAVSGGSRKAKKIFEEVKALLPEARHSELVGIALQVYTQRASRGPFEFQRDDGPGLDIHQIKRIRKRTIENNYNVWCKWADADSSQVKIFLLRFQLLRERAKSRALTKRIDEIHNHWRLSSPARLI